MPPLKPPPATISSHVVTTFSPMKSLSVHLVSSSSSVIALLSPLSVAARTSLLVCRRLRSLLFGSKKKFVARDRKAGYLVILPLDLKFLLSFLVQWLLFRSLAGYGRMPKVGHICWSNFKKGTIEDINEADSYNFRLSPPYLLIIH
ncbi:hypothetical protein PIB30_092904 [Stylosanthes scabra]|uniref:Uncharacterized protein n=1 Tax=Stylosanthes scabra TaxID=79078 RepID=A0ABU6ZTL2_9FABA|nr:hypothetical protein [Stylosanthes scabra]